MANSLDVIPSFINNYNSDGQGKVRLRTLTLLIIFTMCLYDLCVWIMYNNIIYMYITVDS